MIETMRTESDWHWRHYDHHWLQHHDCQSKSDSWKFTPLDPLIASNCPDRAQLRSWRWDNTVPLSQLWKSAYRDLTCIKLARHISAHISSKLRKARLRRSKVSRNNHDRAKRELKFSRCSSSYTTSGQEQSRFKSALCLDFFPNSRRRVSIARVAFGDPYWRDALPKNEDLWNDQVTPVS